MNFNVNEVFVVAEIKDTKNPKYKLLVLGATDFSGSLNTVMEAEKVEGLKKLDKVEVHMTLKVENKRIDNEFYEVVSKRNIVSLKVVK